MQEWVQRNLCCSIVKEHFSKQLVLWLRLLRKRHVQSTASDHDWKGAALNLQDYTDKECMARFRFRRTDIYWLRKAFGIEEIVKTREQDALDGTEALHFAETILYANRWIDLRRISCRHEGTLSRIFYCILRHVDRSFSYVTQRTDVPWLKEENFH